MPTAPISVVIPAYNVEKFIGQAIKSVQNQTVKVAEIIVIDDNSTDRTAEIAEEMGVTVLKKATKFRGISTSRNQGIKASSCQWIALLDADDIWEKRKIEYQWQAIQARPDAGLISCYTDFLDNNTLEKTILDNWAKKFKGDKRRVKINRYCSYFEKVDYDLLHLNCIHTSTVILKRDVFSKLGFFDESLPVHEDTEFFLRVWGSFPWLLVERHLSSYRFHDNNTVKNTELMFQTAYLLIDKVLQSPEKYPAGISEYYLKVRRDHFLIYGAKLAQQLREKKAL